METNASVKRPTYRISSLLILCLLTLSIAACNSSTLSSYALPKSKVDGGNGDGYTGIQIESAGYVLAGAETEIRVIGGRAPFDVRVDLEGASIRETSNESIFIISVPKSTIAESFQIHVIDQDEKEANKKIWIWELEIPELHSLTNQGVKGRSGYRVGVNSSTVILLGEKVATNRNERYGFYPFYMEPGGGVRVGESLSGEQDYRIINTEMLLTEDYLVASFPRRNVDKYSSLGSVSLFRLKPKLELVDYVTSPVLRSFDRFGTALASYENTIAVTSMQAYQNIANVFIYQIEGEGLVLKEQVRSPGEDFFRFGGAVAINKNNLFVTSNLDSVERFHDMPRWVHIYKRGATRTEYLQKLQLTDYFSGEHKFCKPRLKASEDSFFVLCSSIDNENLSQAKIEKSFLLVFKEKNQTWSLDQRIPIGEDRKISASTGWHEYSQEMSVFDDSLVISRNQSLYFFKKANSSWGKFHQMDVEYILRNSSPAISLYQGKLVLEQWNSEKATSLLIDLEKMPSSQRERVR